jgi:hypothetical protein
MFHNLGLADTRRCIDNDTLWTVQQDVYQFVVEVVEMKLVFIDMLKTVP